MPVSREQTSLPGQFQNFPTEDNHHDNVDDDDHDDNVDNGDDEKHDADDDGKHRDIRCTWVFSHMSQQSTKLLKQLLSTLVALH